MSYGVGCHDVPRDARQRCLAAADVDLTCLDPRIGLGHTAVLRMNTPNIYLVSRRHSVVTTQGVGMDPFASEIDVQHRIYVPKLDIDCAHWAFADDPEFDLTTTTPVVVLTNKELIVT